ncbi:hypothetical protein [Brevibacillus migulae]|uniref:hypothetical protein n=1 Tax=Brevibacillus migulae TaxID=1644114 RepID=UPI00106E363F|nr:hypothetical protein [Brevibacillus migulae]
MVASVPKVLRGERIKPYSWHMAQVQLRGTVNPIQSYTQQQLYRKEQEWLTASANALSFRYESIRSLDKTAAELEKSFQGLADGEASEEGIEQLVQLTSQLVSQLSGSADQLRDQEDPTASLSASLSSIANLGVRKNEDGSYQLDADRFRFMLDVDFAYVRQAFTGRESLVKQIKESRQLMEQQPFELSLTGRTSEKRNPYLAYGLPQLFLQHAASQGMFFNQYF